MKNGAAIRTGTNQNIIDLGTKQNKFKNHKNKVYKIHNKKKNIEKIPSLLIARDLRGTRLNTCCKGGR